MKAADKEYPQKLIALFEVGENTNFPPPMCRVTFLIFYEHFLRNVEKMNEGPLLCIQPSKTHTAFVKICALLDVMLRSGVHLY